MSNQEVREKNPVETFIRKECGELLYNMMFGNNEESKHQSASTLVARLEDNFAPKSNTTVKSFEDIVKDNLNNR